jgi:hypothetical protein
MAAFVIGWRGVDQTWRRQIPLVAFLTITVLLYGLLKWDASQEVYGRIFKYVPLQWQRFHFLHPLVWFALFAAALDVLIRRLRKGHEIVVGLLLCQIALSFFHHEHFRSRSEPRFGEFFASRQFHNIAEFIGRPQSEYRVASLGIHPAIALYNGFYTLDAYLQNYPLTYKHEFRRIIRGELDKSPSLRDYYDNWGSRVYLYSARLHSAGYSAHRAGNSVELEKLSIDLNAFRAMGGEFILSAVRLGQGAHPGLELMRVFPDASSAWDIYLYRALP